MQLGNKKSELWDKKSQLPFFYSVVEMGFHSLVTYIRQKWYLICSLSCLSLREDCPEYCVFENGVLMKKVASLSSYTPQLQDMVTFYLGCSFGFESALKAAGVPVRNVEQGKNVSMYKVSKHLGPGLRPCAVAPKAYYLSLLVSDVFPVWKLKTCPKGKSFRSECLCLFCFVFTDLSSLH